MKIKIFFNLIFLLFFLSIPSFPDQSKKSPKDLGPEYRKWLEEEVVYIITPKEKEVFLQLETDRERNLFNEAFWKHRDPNPNTPVNEFKQEHYRRIIYTNQWFGRESPGPGWRTEMGRIYIILGEPQSIERFESMSEVYPVVIWTYGAKPEQGLPAFFNVVFFKKDGMGEYKLYSPVRYGPQHLLIHYKGDPSDYLSAYYQLQNIEPQLAQVSLTLIPSETTASFSPSIASEVLLNVKIPEAPHHQVKDSYAEKLLAYKDIVEIEYSANYIENDSCLKVILDRSGIYFVHYLIEPSKLTFEQYGKKFLSNLEINAMVSDLEGNTIFQYERTIPIEFNEEQLNNIKAKLFSFQDMFPLIEGYFKLNVMLKNTVSKEFTSLEEDIVIPEPSDSPQISSLLLANRIVRDSEFQGKSKPFFIRNIQLVPSPRNDFTQKENLYLFFQIHGLTRDLLENGFLEYSISAGDQKVFSSRKNIKEYPDAPDFLEEISLANFAPVYYKLRVSLFDKNQNELLFEEGNFYISHVPDLPRPWLLSLPMSSSEDPVCLNMLGTQYFNKRNFPKARLLLEEAYRKSPASAKFALDFCRSLFALKEYQKVKEIASPFLDRPESHEFLAIMGQSCKALSEFGKAISHYKNYLSHYGTNILILNSIGECYYQLGDREEALIAWEKSLEINPKQEKLKKIIEGLKEKK